MSREPGRLNPWDAPNWDKTIRPVTDAPPDIDLLLPPVDQIAEAWYSENGDRWDGDAYGLVHLVDGRWLVYETFYGPTGDGFCEDAYGGDAEVLVASNRTSVIRYGLSDEGRLALGVSLDES